ncbi:hypothetical protein FQN52_001228 [Onygenales sp. PD_12]|nr:hypothetical protein FQN52_001228 [Onygenales sp. PD_12]
MVMKGEGLMAVGVMWMMTTLTLIFVVLRVYTRLVVVKSYGMDDHGRILLVLFTVFITLSAQRGFGQNVSDIGHPQDIPSAILLEAIGQIFAVLGMAVAKWSLGLFLLRIVVKIWQQVVIWTVMLMLMGASISLVFCFMLQCSPPAYLWDRAIEGGHCDVPMLPVSIVYATACVFTDFFFALLPWVFIWRLQMSKREKLTILFSMSLGLIAGAFGIMRAVEIPSLMDPNYTSTFTGAYPQSSFALTNICDGDT